MPNRIEDGILDQFSEGLYKPFIIKFIHMKRAKGEKVRPPVFYRLKYINNFLHDLKASVISKDIVDQLLFTKINTNGHVSAEIVSLLRGFTEYMSLFVPETFVIPGKYIKQPKKTFFPYIFSEDDLKGLVEAADHYGEDNSYLQKNFKIYPYPFIVRMLIGTGMRISEVLALKVNDLDLENGVIQATNSKNGISRLIPMSSTLGDAMSYYYSRIIHQGKQPLFQSPFTGDHYTYEGMVWFFKTIRTKAGLQAKNGRKATLHSFRHTFCTKSLNRMISSGMNFYSALPILSAYVGHINTLDTER
jgi:integrase/recombinase XerD